MIISPKNERDSALTFGLKLVARTFLLVRLERL
ncbi:hypothetical protein VTH8203_01295 [Vibrio thalassae]|uniref:Uncharacterized protein n=1 Tax=Vibrio thalassae TaxID=1243014 RepID=A0A240EIA7_9VIBR|nr:hypothetical protein VTH8203_01295 [Vibrio thalassae]